MKTKLLFIVLALSMALSAWSQQSSANIGYLVAVETKSGKLEITRATSLNEVYTLAEIHLPGNCVDFASELQQSVFYQTGTQQMSFYVEVKRVNRHGKFRHLSNHRFRAMVQAQRLATADTITNNQTFAK